MNKTHITTCSACGATTDSVLCLDCTEIGIGPEMTAQQRVRHVSQQARRGEYDLDESEGRHERNSALIDACKAWFGTRNAACKDERQLANTEEDLVSASRSYFQW